MAYRVMVYGSLKRGFYNHHVFPSGSEFMHEVASEAAYTMLNLGAYPGVIEKGNSVIYGELWSVPSMTRLDILEENGEFYTRYQRRFYTCSAQQYTAWIYLLPTDYPCSESIPGGRWLLKDVVGD